MRAALLDAPGAPLRIGDLPEPRPGPSQLLLQVRACAVCRTDLHIADGELPRRKSPVVLGHEIVGVVLEAGPEAKLFRPGDRVGVPWLGFTCGRCDACVHGHENLCASALFTGYDLDGGYAERAVADERFCFPIPPIYSDAEAAPLLCAGLIGHRSLRMAGDPSTVGIYGFGAAAHIVTQLAVHEGRRVFAFTRTGDSKRQALARSLGAAWAGGSSETPPEPLDAALLFASSGALVPVALQQVRPGGTVVCGGIHMSDIPSFPYSLLWGERVLRSVANLTRRDGLEFLTLAPRIPIRPEVEIFRLKDAELAQRRLREGQIRGAAVIVP